jgi:peptide/nickel transport system ATP-binding protein/oligopeptide transport system ATP-binding protein
MSLLQVENLKTYFYTDEGVVKAVDGVSFSLDRGETLGVVGESGCGKTMMALSLLRLVPEPPGKIVGGKILYQLTSSGGPVDLLLIKPAQMRHVRGKRLAMIFQEPLTSLNPVLSIGSQIGEAVEIHMGGSKKEIKRQTIEMLKLVGIPAPEKRADDYPHQLSGGMRQRAMIAMALSCKPDVLIADEPTTALDVTIQAQILDLINDLQQRLGMAMILVTHDFGIVAEVTRRVIVMYAGRFVEEGPTADVFEKPLHPYTQGLLRSILPLKKTKQKLQTIPGLVPDLINLPRGCTFQNRCPKVKPKCRIEEPQLESIENGRKVRCYYPG